MTVIQIDPVKEFISSINRDTKEIAVSITAVRPTKMSSRVKPPNTFVNLSRGAKWGSRLGWAGNVEGAPEMVGGHTFIPVRLDFAASDPKEVATFKEGKTATIVLSGSASCKGGIGMWSPASKTFASLSGVPGMHLIFEGAGTPKSLRLKASGAGEWADGDIVAYVGVID